MNLREWALPVYSILMQLAVGALLCLWVVRALNRARCGKEQLDRITFVPIIIIFFTIVLAMIGSHFHLSRPYLSFLAITNFRSSWLSREIAFTLIVFVCMSLLLIVLRFGKGLDLIKSLLGWAAIGFGLIMVYCMARIYLLPTQVAWNSTVTIFSYYGVTLLLGSTSILVILLMDLRFSRNEAGPLLAMRIDIIRSAAFWLMLLASLAALLVIILAFRQINYLRASPLSSAQASLQLILGIYQPLLVMRVVLTTVGIIWLVAVISYFLRTRRSFLELLEPVYIACILVLVGEILERFLFYATHVRAGI